MNAKDTRSQEALLLAEERSQARAELRDAIRRLPVTARRASNPLRWFRRYPVAAGAITALGAVALFGQIRSIRRKAPGGGRTWWRTLSLDLLGAVRRALTAAVTTRLAWRGMTASPSDNFADGRVNRTSGENLHRN